MRLIWVSCLIVALSTVSADVGFGYNYPNPGHTPNNGNGLPHDFFGAHSTQNGHETEGPLVNKHFYIHSAPEDHGPPQPRHFVLGKPQTNYRVVFVKAPSASETTYRLHKQKYSAEFAPVEEKLAVYILAPHEHEIDVNDIATPAPTQPSKPEVHFIQYKTAEEAIHAQHLIQAQYDALGGSSEVTDEGTAPVSSVEGSTSALNFAGDDGHGSGTAASSPVVQSLATKYLPPKIF